MISFKSIAFQVFISLIFITSANAQQPNPPGGAEPGDAKNEAYLFAHMKHSDYGRLYYSVSTDGLHWEELNMGKRVFNDYKGHPDICKGHDGRYYIAGNNSDDDLEIHFWVSEDLITWKKHSNYTPILKDIPEYKEALQRLGAPKIFYDEDSKQYVLTWHTPHKNGVKGDSERYWQSMRTLYVTSKDLKTFSDTPQKLFEWDMGTIDVFIRKIQGKYYAIIKDERYPTVEWTTGKTVRISSSDSLLGPYSYPSNPISPNFREAPMLIPSPDNNYWYMYYEQYPGISYGLSIARNINGPWYQVSGNTNFADWDKYKMPETLRHGCMITISKEEYNKLKDKF
ncbi:MAG: glycoside hydrolase family 43 protein [Flavobacteriales bacterium]|nr:glycoside hydrolase family 43 protein [Flavobacteriales bacterium]